MQTTDGDGEQAYQDLESHKIELQLINEDLRHAQAELEAARNKYRDLFDFAPVGYLCLDPAGRIKEANLTSATVLGLERGKLAGQQLARWVAEEDANTYWNYLEALQARDEPDACELLILRPDGSEFQARLDGRATEEGGWWLTLTDVSREAEAEAALWHQSDARYRALITSSSQALYRMSPDWSEMRQLKGGSFLADTPEPNRDWVPEYIHPDDQKWVLEVIGKAIRGGTRFELEHRVMRADGTLGWTFSRAVPVRNAAGEIVEWFGAASDITGRKQAEEALRESEERFRLSAENLLDAFAIYSAIRDENNEIVDFRVEYANDVACSLTRRKREDYVGRTLLELYPDLRQTGIFDWYVQVVETGNSVIQEDFAFDTAAHGRSGIHYYDVRMARLEDGFTAAWRDVTERKQAEEMLRESEEQLRLHVENTPLAVVEWGPDFRLSQWSGGAERLFGWRAEEVIGKRLDEFRWVYREDVGQVDRISGGLLNGTGLRSLSHNRNYRKDGSIIYCEWYNSSLLDESGNLRSILSLVLDVTDREQLLADLVAARESLEVRVQERTEALHQLNEELRREFGEREKAEAALVHSEELAVAGKLAAGLAHEIKNPLQAIIGCAQLAEEELPSDEKTATYLRMIIQEAQRISALVGELRDLQRPEQEECRQLLSLNEVVEKQLALNGSRGWGQRIEVEWQPAEGLPPVCGVDGRLQQVFLNLLLNAFEAMPEGGQIRVRSEADPEAKGVWLHITDRGPGIPDDILPYIFEPFYTTRDKGQGLGLFICHDIVADHGGRIEVDSRVGEGTTFSVWLPAMQAE
jgi:PAS domain S-box-containing protein